MNHNAALSEKQKRAIIMLLEGMNKTEVAKHIKVARSTITRWVNSHPSFKKALNEKSDKMQKKELDAIESYLEGLRERLPKVLVGIDKALHNGDMRAVKLIHEALKITNDDVPIGIVIVLKGETPFDRIQECREIIKNELKAMNSDERQRLLS